MGGEGRNARIVVVKCPDFPRTEAAGPVLRSVLTGRARAGMVMTYDVKQWVRAKG